MVVSIFVLSIHTNLKEKKRLMKNIKNLIIVALMTVTQFANAADEGVIKSIDANATREAIGMTAITLVPVLVLIIVLVVIGFATQKIPGLKG